ncbi:MAG: TIGR03960 family B12-binding radical SAM protein [Candidatus Omnitrophica bacterium]|nr:TIGR03960 family B12-binding radical SAM protein [Candidatus Omnitrophota bacterium]
MLEDILLQVKKPAQYIGQEWNVSRKDFQASQIKFALCFPDLYEIGMSNLALRIIYDILNSLPEVCCERFFAPDTDMEGILRSSNTRIPSLESHRPLREFDIIGFSLGSELDYTNILNILDLGSIPLEAGLRDHTYPLVIGGGPCVLNPEPMHEFFDLFVVGEAEELLLEFISLWRRHKEEYRSGKMSKQDLLLAFSRIPGIYVPSLYEVRYNPQGRIEKFSVKIEGAPEKVKKRIVGDLNTLSFPVRWLVPYIQIVHDRVTLEVMRGCPNRCRFCQARSQYYPFRQKDLKNILDSACRAYKNTGYEEISLGGLSVSDHSQIVDISEGLLKIFSKDAVSVSLPSIKARPQVSGISSSIAKVKKTGLTFAPEAGSERLRQLLAKDFNERDFLDSISGAYNSGYQHIKLYFMAGLPGETKEDLDSIIEFSRRASELKREITRSPAQVNISVNTFIPKPHTPLQWLGMEGMEGMQEKKNYLLDKTRNKRLKLNFHNCQMSFLEGVLCRGDRRMGGVISAAFKKGARFDAWADHFALDKWLDAFKECAIEPDSYLREKSPDEILPWDFIDIGIDKEYLLAEFNKTIAR